MRPTPQLKIRLRTWLLVAALTGLVIVIGGLLGGALIWICVALAAGMNIGGYWFSDRIALRAVKARPITIDQAPAFHAVAHELARRAGIPTPRLFIMPGEQSNAFATGRNPQHAAVALTAGLLRDLDTDEIRGVLAHEYAHIKHRDILISSIAATTAGAISAIVGLLQLQFIFGGRDTNPLWIIGALAAIVLTPLAAMLIQLGNSREREFLADATAAEILGTGRPLADALETIEALNRPPLRIAAATAPMYFTNPIRGRFAGRLLSTHPPVRQRIRRLRAIDRRARPRESVLQVA